VSGIWPDDVQCTVFLTFDIDGVSSWVRRKAEIWQRPSALSLAEYGPSVAVPRILDLLDQYRLPASFYIPGQVAETHEDMVREIHRRGHEVGAHGYLHEPPPSMERDEERRVFELSLDILSGLTGYKPRGFRSPSADLGPHTLDLLGEHGLLYDTSLMGHDMPYWAESPKGARLVEVPFHWELDDFVYWGYQPPAEVRHAMVGTDGVLATWKDAFDQLYKWGSALNLAFHPQIIGRPSRFAILERLINYMLERPRVRFARIDEAAEQWARDHADEPATLVGGEAPALAAG
jgi:peptidoglycan/xylan/chitin deacetylase (PgdA/CDA1 family)